MDDHGSVTGTVDWARPADTLSLAVSTTQFHVLGPLEVVAGGRTVELGSPKQRAVLAMLALEPNRAVSVDRMVDQLWGEQPPISALGSLHAYVSNLRRVLEPDRAARTTARVLVSRPPGYALVVGDDQLDLLEFEGLASEGSARLAQGKPEEALTLLQRALGLWR